MSDKKKIKVFVLVAFPASNEPNYKFCEDLERLGYDAILLGTNIKSPELNSITKLIIVQIKLLFTAFKSILISNRKDIIVARFDILAVYAIIASKLLLRKRYVIALNIMLKEKKSIRTFFKNKLYKFVMSDSKFIPTVTSKNLINLYKNLLRLEEKKFYYINDDYGKLKNYESEFSLGNGKIFCGGYNARDWDLMFKLAYKFPHRSFTFVMARSNQYSKSSIPSNVDLHFDIKQEVFLDLIKQFTLIILPLIIDSSAGLIVILAAGVMSKPVISTDTIATREYIENHREGFLVPMNDIDSFAEKIEEVIDKPEILRIIGNSLHSRIIEMCSPENYAKKV